MTTRAEKIAVGMKGNQNAAKPEDAKKKAAFTVVCDPKDLKHWKSEAEQAGISFNAYVRAALKKHAG